MKRRRFMPWMAGILLLSTMGMGCASNAPNGSAVPSPTTYEYYVDSETGKPYSPLYESGPVRYVIQFPGYNPYDAFLYGRDFVAFLFVGSKERYAVRNLRFGLERDGRALSPSRNSTLADREWKLYTSIGRPTDPPGGFDLKPAKQALVGFVYPRTQLAGAATAQLEVSFDLIVGDATTPIKRRISLKRTASSEVTGQDPRFREREPGEVLLVGPWWLETDKKDMAGEYDSCVARAVANEECAIRVSGRGFLPRIRYDSIHFEGFFLHVDRKNRKPGWWILWLIEELNASSGENPW